MCPDPVKGKHPGPCAVRLQDQGDGSTLSERPEVAGNVRGRVVPRTGADRVNLEDQRAQRSPGTGLAKVSTGPYPAGLGGNEKLSQ